MRQTDPKETNMDTIERLRQMTRQDLAALGVNDVAYLKTEVVDGQKVVAIHGADGSRLAVVPTHEAAWAAIIQNGLELVSLH